MIAEAYLLILLILAAFITAVAKILQVCHPNITTAEPLLARLAKYCLPILLAIFCIRSFAYEIFYIPSQSMQPTLMPGDIVLVDKFHYGWRVPLTGQRLSPGQPLRGDIAVFRGEVQQTPTAIIKRVVGLPGDQIQYKNRTLYINNLAMQHHNISSDSIIHHDGKIKNVIQAIETLASKQHQILLSWADPKYIHQYNDLQVPANSYYMLGDYRDDSLDSRDTGVVLDQQLVGKAHFILFSVDWLQRKVRWGRIGKI